MTSLVLHLIRSGNKLEGNLSILLLELITGHGESDQSFGGEDCILRVFVCLFLCGITDLAMRDSV